jgi:hypothetical protein
MKEVGEDGADSFVRAFHNQATWTGWRKDVPLHNATCCPPLRKVERSYGVNPIAAIGSCTRFVLMCSCNRAFISPHIQQTVASKIVTGSCIYSTVVKLFEPVVRALIWEAPLAKLLNLGPIIQARCFFSVVCCLPKCVNSPTAHKKSCAMLHRSIGYRLPNCKHKRQNSVLSIQVHSAKTQGRSRWWETAYRRYTHHGQLDYRGVQAV